MSRCGSSVRGFVAGVALLAGCRHGEPPVAEVDASVAPLPPPPRVGPVASLDADAGAPGAGASTGALEKPSAAVVGAAVDAGPDPATLPQTKDKPSASGPALEARVAALWDAIASGDPDRAMPFFFPLPAYEQVKAVGNPGADWRRRLVTAYKRDLLALHARLGDNASRAKFVRLDVPDDRAKWVEPGDEYNKLGYYRVYGTRLVYEVGGKERSFEVTSLISWRGEWFVVHLSGFK